MALHDGRQVGEVDEMHVDRRAGCDRLDRGAGLVGLGLAARSQDEFSPASGEFQSGESADAVGGAGNENSRTDGHGRDLI